MLRVTSNCFRKCGSSAWRACSTDIMPASRSIPSNLKLADVSILDDVMEPMAAEIDYLFPRHPSMIPQSIAVQHFNTADTSGHTEVALNKQIFGAPYRSDIVNNVIRYLRHKRRQPHLTKRISTLSGSNKKPHPQKRQGKAQAGQKRNSVWRSGQKAHGPVLRDFSIDMPKKIRALGMMIVLSMKLREGNIIVVNNFHMHVSELCVVSCTGGMFMLYVPYSADS